MFVINQESTHNDTGLGTGEIRPQEDYICLLKGLTQTMAVRLDYIVNNLSAGLCMDQGKVEEHQQQERR